MNPATKQAIASLLQQAQAQFHAGGYEQARALSQRVLQLDSNNPDAFHMLGVVALEEGHPADAQALLAKALGVRRHNPFYLLSLGHVHCAQENYQAAESSYRRALTLDPRLSPAYLGIGRVLRAQGRSHDAITYLERYLQRTPIDPEGYVELGLACKDLHKLDTAAEHLRTALKMRPDHQAALDGIAAVLLLAGNFREGWPAWLRSWTKLPFPHPATGSAAFADKRVVIYGTGGVGDEIMYCSCLARVATAATAITLHCDPRLTPLLQRSFPSITTLGFDKLGAKRTIGMVAADEIHLPAAFLPAYFPPSSEFSAPRESFLVPDPEQVAQWRKRYKALGTGLKVGLSWRGGVQPVDRTRRSIPLSAWSAILRIRGIHFVNLQYGDTAAEIEQARTTATIHSWDDANPLQDLDFFAAQIAALDLVVSVSNTTVHMAGALGTPVWALVQDVPHWWWGMEGTATPWYGSVELFRQPAAGQWEPVLKEVELRLAQRVS